MFKKNSYPINLVLLLLFSFTIQAVEPPEKNKLEKQLSDLTNRISELEKKNSKQEDDTKKEKSRSGIALGVTYLSAFFGKGTYVRDAYVDGTGIIRTNERYDSIVRLMPSATMYKRLNCKLDAPFIKHLEFLCSDVIVGITGAVSDGINTASKGTAFAIGGTYGWTTSDSALIGFTAGVYFDNTIKQLPAGYGLDKYYLYPNPLLQRDNSPSAIVTNKAIEIPLRNVSAQYFFIGLTATVDFKFKQ